MRAKKITLGFIGAGRVGTGLATGFAHAGVSVVAIASRKIASAQKLAKRVRRAPACAELGIPHADALAALLPLLRGTADNVEKLGAAGGLGSAVARGDVGTIRRHLDVLAKEAPDSLELYRILSLRTIPLALAKGTLKPETAEEITTLLRSRGVSPRGKSDT